MRVLALALTLTLFQYPERDLNPHSLNGHRILSPACLPFHHPGGIKNPILSTKSCVSDPVPPKREFHHPG